MNKARGMPSVALTPQTEEKLKVEDDKEKELQEDPFKRPNLDIKVIDDDKAVSFKEEEKEEPVKEKPKRPKKKLTEKQLEALKRGREKSMATRKAKAEDRKKIQQEKKEAKAPKNHVETIAPPQGHIPYQPPPQQQIDYDRIINGVANIYQQQQQKQQQQEEIEFNVKEFEEKVREEERNKVYGELETIQKEDEQKQAQAVAHKYLNRQPQSINPYAYAFQNNSRKRYQRY